MKDEALRLALEALVDNRHYIVERESAAYLEIYDESIAAVEKALAEQPAQQEPVACVYKATTKKGETAHFGEYSAAKAWAGWGLVEQVPLKTLTLISKSIKPCPTCEALARTVMLDQTSHDAQRKPTDEMVVAAARMLSDRQAAACNVDCGDMWKLHGNDFIDDARAALEAAHGIKGDA